MKAKDYLEDHWMKNKVWTHLKWPRHQRRLQLCATLLEGSNFIDIGCGLGHSTYYMSRWKTGNWSGLEFYERAVGMARELFPEIPFFYSEGFDLFPVCGQFDGVVCSEVIEHVADDKSLVKGLLGIAEKTLVLTTPCRQVSDPGHLRVYTKEALEELFSGTNFDISQDNTFFYIKVKA